MAASHVEDAGAAAMTCQVFLPVASEASDTDSSMESDSSSTTSSISSDVYLRSLWEFMEPDIDCGYIDLESWLLGCAWLHVHINSEDRYELEELFDYYADRGRLPFRRFRRLLRAWGDDRQKILLHRSVMECSWHT